MVTAKDRRLLAPRTFWCLVAGLLAPMAAIQFVTVSRESQTWDESRQLLSGYTYLISGHFTVAREHPPLLKLLWAVPVWFLHPSPPHDGEVRQAGLDFLYRNRVPADQMLMAGRCSAIAISILLGWTVAVWTRRHFGIPAALLAVFLYALDPNFLAHGRYIKNDVGAALTIFAATMAWGAYLVEPTRKRLWLSGLMVGLALATKSSALILWPVMLLLYWLRRWQQRRGLLDRECLRALGTVAAVAFLVIFLVYRCEFAPAGEQWAIFREWPATSWLGRIPIPAVGYFLGVGNIFGRQVGDAHAVGYLLGRQSPSGWWYMSLVALAVKTPLAELAFFAFALKAATRRLRGIHLRSLDFRWYLLSVTPICYFAVSLISRSNVGERHLLPLLPFFFVVTGAVLTSAPVHKWRRIAIAAAGLLLIVETASIHPHYLAFFNALAGGPASGSEYLVDSNLDWGQDVKYLKAYLAGNGISDPFVLYYGVADLDCYGVPHRPLPNIRTADAAEKINGVVAISATLLVTRGEFAGLKSLEPDARVGYSIYIYDLRKLSAQTDPPLRVETRRPRPPVAAQ